MAVGTDQIALGDLTVLARRLPPGQFGFFVTSPGQDFVPNLAGGDGNLQFQVVDMSGQSLDQIGTASPSGDALIFIVDLDAIATANCQVAGQPGDDLELPGLAPRPEPVGDFANNPGRAVTLSMTDASWRWAGPRPIDAPAVAFQGRSLGYRYRCHRRHGRGDPWPSGPSRGPWTWRSSCPTCATSPGGCARP